MSTKVLAVDTERMVAIEGKTGLASLDLKRVAREAARDGRRKVNFNSTADAYDLAVVRIGSKYLHSVVVNRLQAGFETVPREYTFSVCFGVENKGVIVGSTTLRVGSPIELHDTSHNTYSQTAPVTSIVGLTGRDYNLLDRRYISNPHGRRLSIQDLSKLARDTQEDPVITFIIDEARKQVAYLAAYMIWSTGPVKSD